LASSDPESGTGGDSTNPKLGRAAHVGSPELQRASTASKAPLVHGLGAEVASTHRPLIVLFFKDCSGKPEQGLTVGEDADHVATPGGRPQVRSVFGGNRVQAVLI